MARTTAPLIRFFVYKAADGWRWHSRNSRNGKLTADSGEAYTRRAAAVLSVDRHIDTVRNGDFRIDVLNAGEMPPAYLPRGKN